jgi:predicted RNA-binding Zn-ribbon protein involved in translation (DUF1610 family)
MSWNPFIAISAVNSFNIKQLQFESDCLQCGALVNLREGEHILSCPYCRTRQILVAKDYPVYFIKPVISSNRFLYIPYWLIQGRYYFIDHKQILDRLVDITFRANMEDRFPMSLGLRHQVLKLTAMHPQSAVLAMKMNIDSQSMLNRIKKLIRPENPKECAKIDVQDFLQKIRVQLLTDNDQDIHDWLQTITTGGIKSYVNIEQPSLKNHSANLFFDEFIEDRSDLIYFPYSFQNNVLMDGITGSPVPAVPPIDFDELSIGKFPNETLWISKALICPGCGADLKAWPDSVIYPCCNCGKAFGIRGETWFEYPIAFHDCGDRDSLYLPFWKMAVTLNGLKKWKATAENKPCEIAFDPSASIDSVFWIPGFRCNSKVFIKTAMRMSLINSQEKLQYGKNPRFLFPVTLSDSFAFRNLRLILFEMARKKGILPDQLQNLGNLSLRNGGVELIYIPFNRLASELVHLKFMLAVPQSAIRGITTAEEVMTGV